MCCQLAPPSLVFHAKCQVPAYTTLGSLGSTAMDSMFLTTPSLEEMRCQLLPPSLLRYTPSRSPATITLLSEADTAMARTDLPCSPGIASQSLPPLRVRKMSP